MSGSNNLLQWNPGASNMESDADYANDPQRLAGAQAPAEFPSATANKLFYQSSTFNKAFGDALAAKGYTISDANIAALTAVLGNVMTQADLTAALANVTTPAQLTAGLANLTTSAQLTAALANVTTPAQLTAALTNVITGAQLTAALVPYAPLANPVFPGNLQVNGVLSVTGLTNLGGGASAVFQPGGGTAADASNNVANTGWVQSYFAKLSSFGFSGAQNGYAKFPGGLIVQWGVNQCAGLSSGDVIPYPLSGLFTNVMSGAVSLGGVSSGVLGFTLSGNQNFTVYCRNLSNVFTASTVAWIVFGF